ncbi:MAG: Ig-like domain-containing protein [Eubacterium sp.]|nr:Ig-like domain-containing protein [Eubacterium sp.]
MKKTLSIIVSTIVFVCCVCLTSVAFAEEFGNDAHTHNYVSEITKPATCTESGILTSTCAECGDTKIEKTDMLEHTYETVITKATTSKNGLAVTTCTECGDIKSESIIYYPKTVTLSSYSYEYTGKAIKPSVTIKDSNGKKIDSSNYTVSYSNNTKIGQATVKIKFKGNYSGSITKNFDIVFTVNSVKFPQSEFSIGLNESYPVTAKNQNNTTIPADLTYSTSNSKIVSVSSSGVATGKKIGSATITVKYKNGKKGKVKINVTKAPASVTLNIKSATIGVGEKSIDLNSTVHNGYGKRRIFSSSNTKVATVNSNGIVTGVAPGTVTITCKTYNGKKATCKITVKKAPKKITISNKNKKVQNGTNLYKIKYKLESGFASYKVTYKSSNTKIAKVSSTGIVTGVKNGTATITVTAYNGINAKIKISVVNENNCLPLNKIATQISYDYDNVEKYVFGKTSQGRNLEAYIITPKNKSYKKTYVMNFAIHGFEDSYSHDGKVLVEEGNKLVQYYAENPDKLMRFRLVIIPCLNPDGTIAGKNNQRACSTAFGRCTAKHVDMNRDFMSGRFKATESRSMRSLLSKYKPDVYTDFHGWLNEVYGTGAMCQIFARDLHLARKKVDNYASSLGYINGYVHKTYSCPSTLVEYTSPSKVNHKNTYTAINNIIKYYS